MSNHLGDTNKMVDTPRTNQVSIRPQYGDEWDWCRADFARQLERELNAASKERDDALMMLGMYRMKSDEQKQRIKRLEDAGDAHLEWVPVSFQAAWRKAKEAKL